MGTVRSTRYCRFVGKRAGTGVGGDQSSLADGQQATASYGGGSADDIARCSRDDG